jgi:alkylated DNA repair dioxygenase AlkB
MRTAAAAAEGKTRTLATHLDSVLTATLASGGKTKTTGRKSASGGGGGGAGAGAKGERKKPQRLTDLKCNHVPDDVPMTFDTERISTSRSAEISAELDALVKKDRDTIVVRGRECTEKRRTGYFTADPSHVYSYSGKAPMKSSGWPAVVAELAEWAARVVNADTSFVYTDPVTGEPRPVRPKDFYALVNVYETGDDSVGWHNDKDALPRPASSTGGGGVARPSRPICSLSFGAERDFVVRRKGDGVQRAWVRPKDGSLLYMRPGMQETWEHELRAAGARTRATVGRRVNLTLRLF